MIDLDNTLYLYEPAHQLALEQCYYIFSKQVDISADDFAREYRHHRNRVTERLKPQGACRSRLLAFQGICEDFKLSPSYVVALNLSDIYWSTLIKSMILLPEAKDFLKRCTQLNIPICIVTDMLARIQIQKIIALGIDNIITHLVSSEEAGAEKPQPAIFKLALKKINCQAKDVIMIGDSQKKDIDGAEALGIKGYLVNW